MDTGYFYFIKDDYYYKFPNCNLMLNKDSDSSGKHGRPCYYCLKEGDIYWMIPISSQISKYQAIYDNKIQKTSACDGIRFGYVNGQKRVFLIQNICPITNDYIDSEYTIQKGTTRVTVNKKFKEELEKTARKALRLHRNGIRVILTDIDFILNNLKM